MWSFSRQCSSPKVLVENFGIADIGTVDDDIRLSFGG